MSTIIKHTFAPQPRATATAAVLGKVALEAQITPQEHSIMIHVLDHALPEGPLLVGEIEIVLENGELLLHATTNEQLDQGQDGEPALRLYDSSDPYCREEDG